MVVEEEGDDDYEDSMTRGYGTGVGNQVKKTAVGGGSGGVVATSASLPASTVGLARDGGDKMSVAGPSSAVTGSPYRHGQGPSGAQPFGLIDEQTQREGQVFVEEDDDDDDDDEGEVTRKALSGEMSSHTDFMGKSSSSPFHQHAQNDDEGDNVRVGNGGAVKGLGGMLGELYDMHGKRW